MFVIQTRLVLFAHAFRKEGQLYGKLNLHIKCVAVIVALRVLLAMILCLTKRIAPVIPSSIPS